MTMSHPQNMMKFGDMLFDNEEMILEDNYNNNNNNNNNNSRYSNASEMSTTTSNSSVSPRLSSFCNIDDHYSDNTFLMSPWTPYLKSPWVKLSPYPHPTVNNNDPNLTADSIYVSRGKNCLVGSLLREEGHVYSLAVKDGMLFAGSDSKNIRVWTGFRDVGGFKSSSGLVKAIVTSKENDRVFTGHQDGKIRVWNTNGKRISTLPKLRDYFTSSMNPKNYVSARRHQKVLKIKHFDAVSCMSLNEDIGVLYSGSWDKTIKVWRVSDGKCLESIDAHDDAINSIAIGFDGLVFSGSADGTVKVWRRELDGKTARHCHVTTLLTQENAVTSLCVSEESVLYAGSSDGLVKFWEREKEELCYGGVLRGHKMGVLCLGTAGSLVFSGSADKTICVWKRDVGGSGVHSCLSVLTGHAGPVKCLAVERDGGSEEEEKWVVYSGSLDKSVKIWSVSEDAPDDDLTY